MMMREEGMEWLGRVPWVPVFLDSSPLVYISFNRCCTIFGDVVRDEKDHVELFAAF